MFKICKYPSFKGISLAFPFCFTSVLWSAFKVKNVRPRSGLNSDLPPQKGHIHIQTPVPVSVSLFEKRVFAGAMKLKILR